MFSLEARSVTMPTMKKIVNSLIEKDNITPEMVNELLLSLESHEQEIQQKDLEI